MHALVNGSSGVFYHMQSIQRIKGWAKRLQHEVYAVYLAQKDPRTPWYAKALAAAIVAYAFSPIDLIPDPIPVIGYLDDLLIVPLGIALLVRLIPPEVLEECRQKAREELERPRRKNWIAASVIIIIWIALLWLAVMLILRFVSR